MKKKEKEFKYNPVLAIHLRPKGDGSYMDIHRGLKKECKKCVAENTV